MSSSVPERRPLARRVEVTTDELRVDLADGRRLNVPLVWCPRLVAAAPDARAGSNCWVTGKGSTRRTRTRTSPSLACSSERQAPDFARGRPSHSRCRAACEFL